MALNMTRLQFGVALGYKGIIENIKDRVRKLERLDEVSDVTATKAEIVRIKCLKRQMAEFRRGR